VLMIDNSVSRAVQQHVTLILPLQLVTSVVTAVTSVVTAVTVVASVVTAVTVVTVAWSQLLQL